MHDIQIIFTIEGYTILVDGVETKLSPNMDLSVLMHIGLIDMLQYRLFHNDMAHIIESVKDRKEEEKEKEESSKTVIYAKPNGSLS